MFFEEVRNPVCPSFVNLFKTFAFIRPPSSVYGMKYIFNHPLE